MPSWKPEVQTTGDAWTGNALRFATKEESDAWVTDLMFRWTAVSDIRSVESDDAPTHAIVDRALVRIEGDRP